ncbi:MAG: nicotinate-nucleotide adenylyltransferase [Pseudomonadota bacterium]
MSGGDQTEGVARRHLCFPHCEPGQRIGLFGGSFNPPHEGHLLVSELGLSRLKLDQIWWLVTPGNPLKDHSNLAPLARRLEACEALARHPAMKVTAVEAVLNSRYTADTLAKIASRFQANDFVWLMGADNLGQFHLWERWREIAGTFPIGVIDRPGSTLSLHSAQGAIALSRFRMDEDDAALLARQRPPAWTFIHGPRNSLSSTLLRSRAASAVKA